MAELVFILGVQAVVVGVIYGTNSNAFEGGWTKRDDEEESSKQTIFDSNTSYHDSQRMAVDGARAWPLGSSGLV